MEWETHALTWSTYQSALEIKHTGSSVEMHVSTSSIVSTKFFLTNLSDAIRNVRWRI